MKMRLPAATVALLLLGGARGAGRAGRAIDDGRDLEDHDPRPGGRQRRGHRAQEQVHRGRRDRRLAAVGDERGRHVADRPRHDHGGHDAGSWRGLPARQQRRRDRPAATRPTRPASPTTAASQLRSSAAATSVIDAVGSDADRPRDPVPRGRRRWCSRPSTATTPSSARTTARRTPTTTTPTSSARTDESDAELPEGRAGLHEDHRHPDAGRRQPAVRRPERIKIRGIVTGVDDLYGSNFDFVFKSDAGSGSSRPRVTRARRPRARSSSPACGATPPTRRP